MKNFQSRRTKVFISYCHKDTEWLERLLVHLKPLEREGVIESWNDTMIKPGSKWREEIRNAINSAKVAVLLLSADFLASDFIVKNELPPLLTAANKKGTVILPVLISPSRFEQIKDLSQFQGVNPPSNPLIRMTKADQEELFVKVTKENWKQMLRPD